MGRTVRGFSIGSTQHSDAKAAEPPTPLHPRRATWLAGAAVTVLALTVYVYALAPTVTLVDSGELIVAAHSLGVAHPPGFPLYLLLAHLAAIIPLGNVAQRVNFASALFAALAAGMVTVLLAELMQFVRAQPKRSGKKKRAAPTPDLPLLTIAPAALTGLLFAFSRTLWSYATIAEVYALNILLIAGVLFLMLRWRANGGVDDRSLYAAALLFGLALGVHHVTVALILPGLAVLSYRTAGGRIFFSKRLLIAAAISFAGLIAVYSYLPVAAARNPILNWGNPRSLQTIWWHITGRQYQAFFEFTPAMIGRQLSEFCALVLRQFSRPWMPLALLLSLAGIIFAFRRDRTVFWFLIALTLGNLSYPIGYNIAEDKDAYYLPTFLVFALGAGLGAHLFLELCMARQFTARGLLATAVVIAIGLPALSLAANWPFNNRRNYFIARDYLANIERTVEPGGLLITLDWQVASPMLYAREIEGQRRDIKLVDVNLLRRSWYFDYLRRAYPEMMERSRREMETFLAQLRAWEENPAAFAKDDRRSQQIETAFHDLLHSLVQREHEIAPVFLTYDVMVLTAGSERTFTNWLLQTWQIIPRGLVFRLEKDRGFHDPGELELNLRGLTDGSVRFECDDVVKQKVLPAYAQMLLHRGLYFAFFGKHPEAIASFEQALLLDPHLAPARQALITSRARLTPP